MRIIRRLTAVIAAVVVIGLAASGATYALWSSTATATATVTAGSAGVTITGGSSLAVTYSASVRSRAGSLVVTNSGTVPTSYTTAATLGTGSSTGLASAVRVTVWPMPATCAATPPAGAVSGTWSAVPAIAGALAPGASATWCVRTSVTAAQASSFAGAQVTPALTTTATIGAWSASSVTTVAQSVLARPVDPAAWVFIKTTLTPQKCMWPRFASGPPVAQTTCGTATQQHWRFTYANNGNATIISRTAPTTRWTAASTGVGAAITLTTSTNTRAQWVVTTNANGTLTFKLAANTNRCAAVTGPPANDDTTVLTLANCAAVAAQQFQVVSIGNPSPPAVALVCSGDNFTRYFDWPDLIGYQDSVVYRVRMDGVLLTNQYTRGTGFDTTIQFSTSTASLLAKGVGSHAIVVEQSVNGTAYTTTGTGVLTIAAGPTLGCG